MTASFALKKDRAYQRLRAIRPPKMAALVDGEPRELAVANGRGRWERVLRAARDIDAEAIECRDEEDRIVEIIIIDAKKHERNKSQPSDDETAEEDRKVSEVRDMVALCLDAADRSVGRQESHVGQVLDAAIQVMQAAANRAERNERALDKVLRAHSRLLMRESNPNEDDGMGSTADMLAMMSAMLHGDPGALKRLQGGAAAGGNGSMFDPKSGEQMVQVPKSLVDKAVLAMKAMDAQNAADAEVVEDAGAEADE